MELVTYNKENASISRALEPNVRFCYRTGVITFNKGAMQLIGLNADVQVEFLHDKQNPEDWYVASCEKNGFPLRNNGKVQSISCNSSKVARRVIDSIKRIPGDDPIKITSLRISNTPVPYEGRKLWLLITSKPINSRYGLYKGKSIEKDH